MRTKQIIDHHYHLCTVSRREREKEEHEKDVIYNNGIDYCYLSLLMLGMNFTFFLHDAKVS